MAMAVLDGAIANIALPTIARELGTSATAAIWVINIYQIAIVMLLLPFAAAGEILGYRRVYLLSVALFVAASLGCSLAGSLPALVAWRFVQGIGAAAVMAINAALLRHTIPASQLGRSIGYNAIACRSHRPLVRPSPPLSSWSRRDIGYSRSMSRSVWRHWRSAGETCRQANALYAGSTVHRRCSTRSGSACCSWQQRTLLAGMLALEPSWRLCPLW